MLNCASISRPQAARARRLGNDAAGRVASALLDTDSYAAVDLHPEIFAEAGKDGRHSEYGLAES